VVVTTTTPREFTMNSKTTLSVILAALCIVALGLGAATLTTTTEPGSPEFGGGDGAPGEDDDRQEPSPEPSANDDEEELVPVGADDEACIAGYDITELTIFLMMVAFAASVVVFIRNGTLMPALVVFPMVAVPLWFASIVVFAFMGCAAPGGELITETVEEVAPLGGESDGENGGGDGEEPAPISVRFGMAGLLGSLVVGLLLTALYLQRRDAKTVADDPEIVENVPEPAELGAVAGATADTLEEKADFENAIYEAWKEMTDILDVESPETSTPREFAEAAQKTGLAQADVTELTELFESVRYGAANPTPEREDRAIETLRRIEQTYDTDSPEPTSEER